MLPFECLVGGLRKGTGVRWRIEPRGEGTGLKGRWLWSSVCHEGEPPSHSSSSKRRSGALEGSHLQGVQSLERRAVAKQLARVHKL